MSSLRARLIDRNRFSKRYPFIKAPKRTTYMGSSDFAMELGTLTFSNESEKTFTFEAQFPDANYKVIAMPREAYTSSEGSAMVALAVDGNTLDRQQVTIKASAKFTGKVDIIAIRVD